MEDLFINILKENNYTGKSILDNYFISNEFNNSKEDYNDFEEYYFDSVSKFKDWYVSNYNTFDIEVDCGMVYDCIKYEKEKYGTSALLNISEYYKFKEYIISVNILKYLYENEDDISNKFKLHFKINYESCIF